MKAGSELSESMDQLQIASQPLLIMNGALLRSLVRIVSLEKMIVKCQVVC